MILLKKKWKKEVICLVFMNLVKQSGRKRTEIMILSIFEIRR